MFQYAFISYICKYTKGGALNKGLCTFAAWKKKKDKKGDKILLAKHV